MWGGGVSDDQRHSRKAVRGARVGKLPWRSWQRVRLLTYRSSVRTRSGALPFLFLPFSFSSGLFRVAVVLFVPAMFLLFGGLAWLGLGGRFHPRRPHGWIDASISISSWTNLDTKLK